MNFVALVTPATVKVPLNADGTAPEIVIDVVPATNPVVLATVAVAVVEFTSAGPVTVPPVPVPGLPLDAIVNAVAVVTVAVQVPL